MKHYEKRRSVSSKLFVMMLALVLVFGCAVGGTIAWLTAETAPVVNTFTYGDINIELTETKPANKQAKIIPGVNIEKDPKVTVKPNSEACYLFVKVEAAGTFVADKVEYSVRDGENGWTKLTGVSGVDNVYYREISEAQAKAGVSYYVLAGNEDHPNGVVTVKDTLSKGEVENLGNATLTFTAYAIQKEGFATPEAAWTEVSK